MTEQAGNDGRHEDAAAMMRTQEAVHDSFTRPAAWVAAVYLICGSLWILFSDKLLSVLVTEPVLLARLHTFKGWGFVVLTAILLFVLLFRQFRDMALRDRAMRNSETRFRALFDGVNDAIFIHDAETGAILDVNPRMCSMYGWRREEVGRLKLDALSEGTAPYDQTAAMQWMQRALAGEAPTFEWHARRRDGSLFWVEVSMRAYAESGGLRRISALVRDITERRAAAAALRESEQGFATIAHTSPALLWMSEKGTDRVWFNEPWLAFTGRRLEEESGRGWEDGLHPDDREHALQTYAEACRSEIYFRTEYRLRRYDGEYRWLIEEGEPRYNAAGDFIGHVGSCLDVTYKHDATAAVAAAAAENRFRQLMESFPDVAVHGCDQRRRVIFWNHGCEATFGYTEEQALGRQIEDLIVPAPARAGIAAALDAWIAGGPALPSGEMRLQRKDGSAVRAYTSRVMQTNDRGEAEIFCVDVRLPGAG